MRVQVVSGRKAGNLIGSAALAGEREALEAAAANLARASAVSSGLLERMVAVSRGLLDVLALAKDGTYGRSGRVTEIDPRGVRLQERA